MHRKSMLLLKKGQQFPPRSGGVESIYILGFGSKQSLSQLFNFTVVVKTAKTVYKKWVLLRANTTLLTKTGAGLDVAYSL